MTRSGSPTGARPPVPRQAPGFDDALEVMARALVHWGGGGALIPVALRENAVARTRLTTGAEVAVRLHRPGYHVPGAVEAELDWTADLARAGIRCPAPVATRDGALCVTVGAARISVVRWIEAAPLPPAPDADTLHALGCDIAGLHAGPATLRGAVRPNWRVRGLFGARATWGPHGDNTAWKQGDLDLIERVLARAEKVLSGMDDLGPIHGDLLHDNVLRDAAGALHLIDFDDCGIGYRSYDLGTVLVGQATSDGYDAAVDALLAGYARRRAVGRAEIDLMVMLRAVASAGWAASRLRADDPRQAAYAARAVACARRVSEGRGGDT